VTVAGDRQTPSPAVSSKNLREKTFQRVRRKPSRAHALRSLLPTGGPLWFAVDRLDSGDVHRGDVGGLFREACIVGVQADDDFGTANVAHLRVTHVIGRSVGDEQPEWLKRLFP